MAPVMEVLRFEIVIFNIIISLDALISIVGYGSNIYNSSYGSGMYGSYGGVGSYGGLYGNNMYGSSGMFGGGMYNSGFGGPMGGYGMGTGGPYGNQDPNNPFGPPPSPPSLWMSFLRTVRFCDCKLNYFSS